MLLDPDTLFDGDEALTLFNKGIFVIGVGIFVDYIFSMRFEMSFSIKDYLV